MLFKVILLGLVQGITEFLPVSSTAHLVILEKLLGLSDKTFGLSFDIALHLGTTLALLIFFFPVWKKLVISLLPLNKLMTINEKKENNKLLINLIIATIPAVLIGFLFQKQIENIFRSTTWIGIFLILFSFVFYIAEKVSKRNRLIKDLKWMDSIFIGINQAIALIPGVSRSGSTISAGLLTNLDRAEAGKFAFLLSTPVVLGAFLKDHLTNFKSMELNNWLFFVGFIFSFAMGFLTLKYFLRYLNNKTLIPFIIYRLLLGSIILLFLH